jgi:hypothetical protein
VIAMSVSVNDNATPALNRVGAFLASDAARTIVGGSASNAVKGYLDDLEDNRPNQLGGARTHYWSSARQSTSFSLDSDGATVSISRIGMKLHYHGGTVTAGKGISSFSGKPTRYLAIPARAEAHGRKPSDFHDLIPLWGRNGPYALARSVSTMIATTRSRAKNAASRPFLVKRGSEQGGEVMFWLKESVTLQPDPTVIPDGDEISSTVQDDLAYAIARRFKGFEVAMDEGQGGEGI